MTIKKFDSCIEKQENIANRREQSFRQLGQKSKDYYPVHLL
jgi:hypothetical protein